MRNRTLVRVLLGAVAVGFAAAPAAAQSNNDVSVGYSFLRLMEGGDGLNIPAGWNVSFAGGVSDVVSLVGDLGGHYKSIEGDSVRIHTFQGGVRFHGRRASNVVPFGQVLVGGAYGSGGGEGEWVGAVQFGGGVDVYGREGGPGFRAQVDVPVYFSEGDTLKGVRLTFSLVVPIK